MNDLTTRCFFSQTEKHHSALCSWSINACSSWWFLCTICIMHSFFMSILSSFQCDLVVVEVKQIWKNYVCYCYMCLTLIWEELMFLLEGGRMKTDVVSHRYFKKGTVKSHKWSCGKWTLSFHNSLNAVISSPQSTAEQSINHILGSDKEGSGMSTVLCTFLWLQDFVTRSQNIYKTKWKYAVMWHY